MLKNQQKIKNSFYVEEVLSVISVSLLQKLSLINQELIGGEENINA